MFARWWGREVVFVEKVVLSLVLDIFYKLFNKYLRTAEEDIIDDELRDDIQELEEK